jgi:predicted RNA binding protein YcfA (HicA-like mRNA interferase family)
MILDPYEISKILIKNGWQQRKGKTAHAVFTKEGFIYNISIPQHKGKTLSKAHVATIQKISGIKF